MTLPARFAILNRLTDVGRETALQVGKLCACHRAAIPFLRDQRGAWFCDIDLQQLSKSPIRSRKLPADSAGEMPDVHKLLNENAQ
jgi:hypothetical protein